MAVSHCLNLQYFPSDISSDMAVGEDILVAASATSVDQLPPHKSRQPNGFPETKIVNGEAAVEAQVTHATTLPNWIPIREEVLWKPFERLRIVTIGAGFSGKARTRTLYLAPVIRVSSIFDRFDDGA